MGFDIWDGPTTPPGKTIRKDKWIKIAEIIKKLKETNVNNIKIIDAEKRISSTVKIDKDDDVVAEFIKKVEDFEKVFRVKIDDFKNIDFKPVWINKYDVECEVLLREKTISIPTIDELLAEGKSFKEINNIMKEGK